MGAGSVDLAAMAPRLAAVGHGRGGRGGAPRRHRAENRDHRPGRLGPVGRRGRLADRERCPGRLDLPEPRPRAASLVDGLWEPSFELAGARKATARGDTVCVALVIAHALLLCAHALHGRAGRWLISEKGAIAGAGRLEVAPPDFAARCHAVLGALGTDPDELTAAIDTADLIVEDVRAACAQG